MKQLTVKVGEETKTKIKDINRRQRKKEKATQHLRQSNHNQCFVTEIQNGKPRFPLSPYNTMC